MHIIMLYIIVFQELAGCQTHTEKNSFLAKFQGKTAVFEIKPIPPVAAFVAYN